MKLRTVVEEKPVSKLVDDAKQKYGRVDEVYNALQWRLAREPQSGVEIEVSGSKHSIIKSAEHNISGVPVITVLYRYDEDTVFILAIKIDNS